MMDTSAPEQGVVTVTRRIPICDSVNLWSETWGTGPNILVLGGVGSGTFASTPLGASLGRRMRAISYDRRGNGRSTCPPGQDLDLEQAAADALAVLDAHDVEETVVVAACAAAAIGLELLQVAPTRVTRLVLHEPLLLAMLSDEDEVAQYVGYADHRRLGPAETVGTFLREHDLPYPAPFRLTAARDGHHWLGHEYLQLISYRPDIQGLRVIADRILVVVGRTTVDRDQPFVRIADALAGRLGAPRVLFPGHHSAYFSDPDQFVEALTEVLQAWPSRHEGHDRL